MARGKLLICLLCAFCHLPIVTNDRVNFLAEEVRSLSELPMERLIQIKTNLIEVEENISDTEVEEEPTESDEPQRSSALAIPVALPLKRMSARKSIRRHGDYWDEKGKDTKISKIFQLTVTALSFLAFGGYLMTLMIMAIRRNQNNVTPGNVIVFSNLQKYKRPKRRAWAVNPMANDFDPDRMYRGLIIMSQCYAHVRQ